MMIKYLIASLCLFLSAECISAQHYTYWPIIFEKEPNGVFSFSKKWDYPEGVIKHDDGHFEKTDGKKLEATDTAHMSFTANCKTNVQGGYTIRYCYATRKGSNIHLNFTDGAPAYASKFNATLKNGTFHFEPGIIYPELIPGEKTSYTVTRSKLILYQKNYSVAHMISGYITAEFTETTQNSKKAIHTNKYYLEGYFKTPVN